MQTLFRLVVPLLIVPAAAAQQFVERPGVLTGPVVWSEFIVPIDVNADGNLDLFIANAQGYEVPGDFGAPSADPMRPTLLVHAGVSGGAPVFVDRTDLLVPASIVIHGKATAVCDVDGDGRADLVLAAAFDDQQRLLRKDPAGPGYLDESFRLPPLVLNAFHVGWGDLDDDGDVDLVFADAGPNSFSAPGGEARLLINDGAGFFTEAPGQINAIPKIGAQNAKIVDVDGDLDLDVIVDGKSAVTQVYFNDGAAHFTLDTTFVPPAASAPGFGAYETEWGDLDGDRDVDCIYMSFTGVADVAMRNQLAETGVAGLVPFPDSLSGDNAQDENDFALLDADDDGDLDLLVATLTFGAPVTPEKLFLSSGSFGPGFLAQSAGAFTNVLDSTLDLAVADFNGDGRYDVVTANGEIPTSPFDNRYYENVGLPDTRPPAIGRITGLPATVSTGALADGFAVRAWIQDAVVDDGTTFVTARLDWSAAKGGASTNGSARMPHVGGYVHRAVLQPEPTSAGLVGATVTAAVAAEDPQANAAQSAAQSFVVCGAEAYGTGTGLTLAPPGAAIPGGALEFAISGGDANLPGALVLGLQPAAVPFGGGTLLVAAQGAYRVRFALDANGAAQVSIPVPASARPGATTFAQAIARSTTLASGLALSNGVEAVLCE